MDLESIMLSEVNQTGKDKHHMVSQYVASKKTKQMNNHNKTKTWSYTQVVARGEEGSDMSEIDEGN